MDADISLADVFQQASIEVLCEVIDRAIEEDQEAREEVVNE